MALSNLVGQPIAKEILSVSLEQGRTSHAYLFCGPDGTGKSICALAFARALVGREAPTDHPDILVVEPDGASLKIEQARRLQRELSLGPVTGRYRVAIIKRADKMTPEAANSLLKTLEDPPKTAVLILLAAHAHSLLPTIVSRCQVVPFRPSNPECVETFLLHAGVKPERAKACAALSGGIIGKGLLLAEEKGQGKLRERALKCLEAISTADPWSLSAKLGSDRQEIIESLGFMAALLRDAAVVSAGCPETILINCDHADLARSLASAGINALTQAIGEVMRATSRIDKNANIQCTLELMFMKMRSEFAQ